MACDKRMMRLSVILVVIGGVGCAKVGTPSPLEAQTASILTACVEGRCGQGETCVETLCILEQSAEISSSHTEPREFLARLEQRVWDALQPGENGRIRCPGATSASAVDTGLTPPASVHCAKGPGSRCVPNAIGPGGYPAEVWRHPAWVDLDVHVDVPHQFHYQFKAGPWKGDANSCAFTSLAFGDLDDDGVWSTYERSGLQDHTGPNAAAGLYIDRAFD